MNDIRPVGDTWIDAMPAIGQLAASLAKTSFVPRSLRGDGASCAAAILTGRELGLGPMASLRGIDVVDGKASLSGQLLTARILAAKHRITWDTVTDTRVTVTITRGDGLSEATVTWTIADAQRAGLAGKSNWAKYPRAMLRNRAISEAANLACPDVVMGLEVPDHAEDGAEAGGGQTVRVQLGGGAETTSTAPPLEVTGPPGSGATSAAPVKEQATEPAPRPAQAPPAAAAPTASRAQLRKLHATIGDHEKRLGHRFDHDERVALLSPIVGRDLESSAELTVPEASAAIDELTQRLEAVADEPAPAEPPAGQ
jgi:hypothetical protein